MSGRQDSNLRPPGPKPGTLPDCATPRTIFPSGRAANVITFVIICACHQKVFQLFCDSAGSRTRNPQLRRLMLYPVELPNQNAERGGFEPPVQFNPYDSLANCWFQPLTHLSLTLKIPHFSETTFKRSANLKNEIKPPKIISNLTRFLA